nr:alpha/beta hydrolase [Micromonospora sp. DSM 115978]
GHSYGCAVATVAGIEDNVKALVYLAGFVPAAGETLGELQGRFPDSDLAQALVPAFFPGGVELSVDVDKFRAVFAHDVDATAASVFAVSQRPLSVAVFAEQAPAAAWRTTPAWGVVASSDHAINPDVQRFGYGRAGVDTIEVDSSHLVMVSRTAEVADVIKTALKAMPA